MNLYTSKNKPGRIFFRYVALASHRVITLRQFQNIIDQINGDIDQTLFIHFCKELIVDKPGHDAKDTMIVTDTGEVVDIYRYFGVKHLMIIENDIFLHRDRDESDMFFLEYINNAEKVITDRSMSMLPGITAGKEHEVLPVDRGEFDVITGYIEKGRVKEAFDILGYLYQVRGHVVYGNKVGHQLGFPTANMQVASKLKKVPGQGVYAGWVSIDNECYKSMINIGVRPTISSKDVTIEAHLFDFGNNIYGKEITIHFLERLRDELRFSNLEMLKSQLERDRENALDLLAKGFKNIC